MQLISVWEAETLIKQYLPDWGTEMVSLPDTIGRVLTRDIGSDRAQPPFHRVAMDGFAISHLQIGQTVPIQDQQLAGEPPLDRIDGFAIEIMTGASLPRHADCVVPYERCTRVDGEGRGLVQLPDTAVEPWMNVHCMGTDAREGDTVLTRGTAIDGAKLAVLASVGAVQAYVGKLPRVVCISTGNELVTPSSTPLPYQIRASNTYMIQGYLAQKGIKAQILQLPDTEDKLEQGIGEALGMYDIVILSGGVSQGKADLIPAVLQKLGVQQVFHSIAQRPGKPMWFGIVGKTLVFGLPGNPVSTLHCYLRYVQPILPVYQAPIASLELGETIPVKANLTLFVPVVLKEMGGKTLLFAHTTNGSGDYVQTAQSHGFVELPQGQGPFIAGKHCRFYPLA